MSIDEAIKLAEDHFRSARFGEADALSRKILNADPSNVIALNLLGMVHLRNNQPEAAAVFFRCAIEIKPLAPGYLSNFSAALLKLGQVDEAIAFSKRAIELNPDLASAYENLTQAFQSQGRIKDAILLIENAISFRPGLAELWEILGRMRRAGGELDSAAAAFREALRLKPQFAEAMFNLGIVLQSSGRIQEALRAYQRVLDQHHDFPQAHLQIGLALESQGDRNGAIDAYRRAIALRPGYANGWNNLGLVLREQGKIAEAQAVFTDGLTHSPEHAILHVNFGCTLLLQQQFSSGWREWEWRRWVPNSILARREFSQPIWDGGELSSQRILLYTEQGFGDAIQFARYLQLVQLRRPKEVLLLCPPELANLFRSIEATNVRLISFGQEIPEFDVHAPLMSLPNIFSTTLQSIPANVPYLHPDASLVDRWRERLAGIDSRRVGLCWAGNPAHVDDRNRSIPFSTFQPLGMTKDVQWISLQIGDAARQAKENPGFPVIDWMQELIGFENTAALIQSLDLVITVDTAIAHLAGALGKPVWVLLPFIPDWRWMLDRDDSPWYPSMRLFRQLKIGDWESVIERVSKELAARNI